MGGIFKSIGSLLGVSKPPKANTQAATDTVTSEATKAKQARAQLYATEGGASGSELNPEQVKKRDTLFGN